MDGSGLEDFIDDSHSFTFSMRPAQRTLAAMHRGLRTRDGVADGRDGARPNLRVSDAAPHVQGAGGIATHGCETSSCSDPMFHETETAQANPADAEARTLRAGPHWRGAPVQPHASRQEENDGG